MVKLLVVDDDPAILEMLVDTLEAEDYDVISATNGEMALDLADESINLLILDVMMPKMDGWAVAKLVKNFADIPILFLTAKGTIHDKLKGFELGADDYLVKPFLLEELLARVKVILRRNGLTETEQISLANCTLFPASHLLICEGVSIDLAPKESELLAYLLFHQGQTLSREQLLTHVWGYDYDKDERTLDVHIKRLRLKLEQATIHIQTVRGIGYRLEEKTDAS